MMNKQKIKIIFLEAKIGNDLEIIPVNLGKVNFSYIVVDKKSSQRYFVKTKNRMTSKWGSLEVEAWAYGFLGDQFPIPKLVNFYKEEDTELLATKFIEGERPSADNATIARNAGNLLRRLHGLKFEGYGEVNVHKNKGGFYSWPEYLEDRIKRTISEIPNEYLPRNIEILTDQTAYDYFERGSLLHLDFQRRNMISQGPDLLLIVDFERAIIGDPLFDLTSVHHIEKIFYDSLLEGYFGLGSLRNREKRKLNLYSAIIELEIYNLILKEERKVAGNLRESIEKRLSK